MLFILLSLSLSDQYEQAEKIKKNLTQIKSEISTQRSIMSNVSDEITILTNKLKEVSAAHQENQKNVELIKESNDKITSQTTSTISKSIQDTLSSNIKSSPVNISLVEISSNEESKKLDLYNQLYSKLISRYKSPSLPQDQNGFYQIKGKSANFTFLSYHVERIAKIEINQTDAHQCGVKAFKVICKDHHDIFTSEVYFAKHHSEKPQVFYFNRTIWFKSMILSVVENFGGDNICLPNVRVFDNDFYLN